MATAVRQNDQQKTPPQSANRSNGTGSNGTGNNGSAGKGGAFTKGMAAADLANFNFRWIILLGLVTASIMEVLDTTIINVALPQMAGNLGATSQEIGWVSTGYILSNVVVLPMTAWLSNVFGRKNYIAFSILLFVVASFFCGTSHSLVELVFWRLLQGAGGAALLSTAQATLREIFPPQEQNIVQTIFLLGIVVAPTLGPSLGGWITDNYSWNWVFYINVPIGLISLFLTITFLKNSTKNIGSKAIDIPGILLLMVGLGSLQYVLEEGNQNDWFQDPLILRLSILSGICLTALIVWELWPTNRSPVINLRVLTNRTLSASLFLFLSLGFGLYAGLYIYPIFAQEILHFTPTETGVALIPGGLMTAVGAIICGRLAGKVDARILISIGMVTFIFSMWQLGHLTTLSGQDDTRVALMVRGLALGFLFAPINLAAFATLEGAAIGQGSALVNLTRQLGGSFGIAIMGTYLSNQTRFHTAMLSSNIYSGNPIFQERQQSIVRNLLAHGYSLPAAQNAALGLIRGTVVTQATTQSFDDAFLLVLVVFFFCTPSVLLLQKPKGKPGAPAEMH